MPTMPISRKQDLREKALLTELDGLIHQPVQRYSSGGSYVVGAKGKKIRLSAAGKVYYEQILSVKPQRDIPTTSR